MNALAGSRDHLAEGKMVRAWIEVADGTIARGLVEALSEHGALIRLAGNSPLAPGAEVAVRLSFDPTAPTVGRAARILRILGSGAAAGCEVEWSVAETGAAGG